MPYGFNKQEQPRNMQSRVRADTVVSAPTNSTIRERKLALYGHLRLSNARCACACRCFDEKN
jgi:hypothetical protein